MGEPFRHLLNDFLLAPLGIAGADERDEPFAGQLPGLMGKPEPVHAGHAAEYPGDFLIHNLDTPWIDGPMVHWSTSSARPSTNRGIVRPRAFAVLRLITSSNFVGCSIGRSPGLAPLRILSTYVAARLKLSRVDGP